MKTNPTSRSSSTAATTTSPRPTSPPNTEPAMPIPASPIPTHGVRAMHVSLKVLHDSVAASSGRPTTWRIEPAAPGGGHHRTANPGHVHAVRFRPAPRARRRTVRPLPRRRGARRGRAHVLGDLFEARVGDDDPSTARRLRRRQAARLSMPACRCSSSAATAISCSARYARRAGMAILPDPRSRCCTANRSCCCTATCCAPTTAACSSARRPAIRAGRRNSSRSRWRRGSRSPRRRQGALRRTAGQRASPRRSPTSRPRPARFQARYGVRRMIHGHPTARDPRRGRGNTASCSATGTNRDRCCGGCAWRDWQRDSIKTVDRRINFQNGLDYSCFLNRRLLAHSASFSERMPLCQRLSSLLAPLRWFWRHADLAKIAMFMPVAGFFLLLAYLAVR